MSSVVVDLDLLAAVAHRLDLRAPNREAVESVVFARSQYLHVDRLPAPFTGVVDVATGVGKTYIMAGLIDYFGGSVDAIRNFAIIAPGRTILDKTIANFTRGGRKSLLASMQADPILITAENFATPAIRSAMEDDSRIKLYVFTVQSLIRPTTRAGRRTHLFQEGLGAGLYEHLAGLEDLVVMADEHHLYLGPAFSDAISGLHPDSVVGLTATPHRQTTEEEIVYRYPLAAAIADGLVKIPVIVGRRDDRVDDETKLLDGVSLLRFKADVVDAYCLEHGLEPVHPVMLVVARDIAQGNELRDLIESSEFDGGEWIGTTLIVNSLLTGDAREQALADLAAVEDTNSPVRIIVSVGMLKEGWDVANVYVVSSFRPSVSDVLTEQTLGRGLRLPFNAERTGIEMLDTLEVVAHESYEKVLRAKQALVESFIDHRTRAVLRRNARGDLVAVTQTEEIQPEVTAQQSVEGLATETTADLFTSVTAATAAVTSVEQRTTQAGNEAANLDLAVEYVPRADVPPIMVPVVTMQPAQSVFSLADIEDLEPFRQLGRQLSANPDAELDRKLISAHVVTGLDGIRRVELITVTAADRVVASQEQLPLESLRQALVDVVLASPIVPPRPKEARAVEPIIDAFLEGLGPDAPRLLAAYRGRAAARLVAQVVVEHRKYLAPPIITEVVEMVRLEKVRTARRRVSLDPEDRFTRSLAYDSYVRSLYESDWFDSAPERALANMVDADDSVLCWVRLQRDEMPILWHSAGHVYNADMIVAQTDGDRWVVEVKADGQMTSDEVLAKRQAARRWANHVNADVAVRDSGVRWRYLLVSETDIVQSRRSWPALRRAGS